MLQKQKVATDAPITPYANLPATESARRCTGAARACAVSTSRTMSASTVASPEAVDRTVRAPSQLTVPAVTSSPVSTNSTYAEQPDGAANSSPQGLPSRDEVSTRWIAGDYIMALTAY